MNVSKVGEITQITPTVTVSSYLWKINNFSTACSRIIMMSPVFSTTFSRDKQEWCLSMYNTGLLKPKAEDYMSIFLRYFGQTSIDVSITFSILNNENCKVISSRLGPQLFVAQSSGYGFKDMLKYQFVMDKKNNIIVDDTINVLCEISYESNLAVPLTNGTLKNYCRLEEFDEFNKLFEAEHLADVVVKIGSNEIKVHKVIVMSRSPVFQAMLEHDMREKEENVIQITDMKYEIMKEVFRFMYVGKVNGIENIASDLLYAAEKYLMKGLKVLCEEQLLKNLNLENALEYLKLANLCRATNLKTRVIKFIVRNQKIIIEKPEFQLLPSELMYEVIQAVVADNSKK